MSRDDALRGPWVAVITDSHGEVYPDLATAVLEMGAEGSVDIAVVRGTAAPDPNVIGAGMPGSYASGDVLYEIEDVYLDDPDDPSVGAEHRWEQARTVADALNAAHEFGQLDALRREIADLRAQKALRPEFSWRHNEFVSEHAPSRDLAEAQVRAAAVRANDPGGDVAVVTRLVSGWRDVPQEEGSAADREQIRERQADCEDLWHSAPGETPPPDPCPACGAVATPEGSPKGE